jgi:small conductance mechanosensitive channel
MELAQIVSPPVTWLAANGVTLLSALAVLVAGWFLSRVAYRAVQAMLPRAYGVDKNFGPLLSQVTRYGIMIFAVVTALSLIGVSSASIYAVLGAAGLAIALGLQSTLSNIAAGIMLIWLRPIAIGEYIVGDGVAGIVVEIGLFGTRLRSTSGLYIFTPNQKLWNSAITNHSREPRRRIEVSVSVPDMMNIAQVRKLLLKIATTDKRVLVDPPPSVHVDSFSGDRVTLQLRAWVPTPNYQQTLRDMTEKAKLAINRELSGEEGGRAEVVVSDDPHTPAPKDRTPDLT